MAFKIGDLKEAHLAGGALAEILGAVVVPTQTWTPHVGRLGNRSGAETCKALETALGHAIPAEIEEWLDVQGENGSIPEPFDTGWFIRLEPTIPAKGPKGAAAALSETPLLLLAGLLPFGHDAGGDRVFVSVRPHPLGLAEPVLLDQTNGEVVDLGAASIADFLVGAWVSDDEPIVGFIRPGNLGAKGYKPVAAARTAFHARVKTAVGQRSDAHDPVALFGRIHWMLGLIDGEPVYRFAEVLARAPSFTTWTNEKSTLAEHPHLALYWMLAHAFLGNAEACREAATLGGSCKGYVVPELATAVLAYCDGKRPSPIEKLSGEAFAQAKAFVAKNARPDQFSGGAAG